MKKLYGRRGDKKPVLRLERHGAASSSSFSSEDLSVSTDSLMTPSLEFPDRTSFRNFGVEDQGSSCDVLTLFALESEIVRRPSSLLLQTMERKHINDDAAYSSSSSDEDLSASTYSFITPSMEFPDRTSFRNVRVEDGEMDHQGLSWDSLTLFTPESEIVRRPSFSFLMMRFLEFQDQTNFRIFGVEDGGSITASWQKGVLLGRGSFGSVYEGISEDGDFFAVKEVSVFEEAQECIQQLEGEIAILSQLQHQNIVRYRGTAKDGSNLYIFLELVSQGSLSKLYHRYQLVDCVVQGYTRQILDGLKYLHDNCFIHRDIKCANILVDASGAVKLADYELAKVSKLNDIKSSTMGTPFWMAPEVINPKRTNGYGKAADIWSLGCTVLEMLTGQIPYFNLENPIQALFRIGKGVLPDIPDTLSQDAHDFILKCLKVNPEERPTAAELLSHPYVRRPLSSSNSGSGSGLGSASPHIHEQG